MDQAFKNCALQCQHVRSIINWIITLRGTGTFVKSRASTLFLPNSSNRICISFYPHHLDITWTISRFPSCFVLSVTHMHVWQKRKLPLILSAFKLVTNWQGIYSSATPGLEFMMNYGQNSLKQGYYNLINNWTNMTEQSLAPLTTTLGHLKSTQCNFNSCSFNY